MPVRGARPKRLIPSGLSDATDGTLAFPGAMAQLGNLIPQPNQKGVFVARPAMSEVAHIPDSAGQATALEYLGGINCGMNPSKLFPGLDEPFLFDGSKFTSVSGLALSNLPATQPTSGDWTPPTIAQVGGRIIFTHPGFPGGTTIPPTATAFYGNTINGSTTLEVGRPLGGYRPPVGATIYGNGVPAGTTVVQSKLFTFDETASWPANSAVITVSGIPALWVGMQIKGLNINAAVIAIGASTVTVNNPPTVAGSSVPVTLDGIEIQMSAPATATASAFIAIASTVANKFGWLDISGFTASILGNTRVGKPYITGGFDITGIQPGMSIKNGADLSPGTQVLQVQNVNFIANCALNANSPVVDLVTTLTDFEIGVGMTVTGPGILAETTVEAYTPSAQTIMLSQPPATAPTTLVALTFSGAVIILSQPAIAADTRAEFDIAGGTPERPQWAAGDLNINPLGGSGPNAGTAPAVFVQQFAGRAYFGVNTDTTAGVQASDAGAGTTQTFISQTLLFEDAVPVTAAADLPLFNQLGGIIQSLIVFQGDTNMQQITGDFSLNNIGVNTLNVATGTKAPNTLATTPRGLLFAASDGLRLINFDAQVSDPLGEHGQGIVTPFINAVTPSRASASFNENVYRLTITWQPPPSVQAVWGSAIRTDEFWFHLADQGKPLHESRWSGPHTSTQLFSAPWPANSSFLCVPTGDPTSLYRSDPKPLATSGYIEFGAQLQCLYESLLEPDSPDGFARVVIETTAWVALASGSAEILATATDDFGQVLDQAYVFIGPFSVAAQQAIPWHTNLIFRQMTISLASPATAQLQLGMIVMRTKGLGYQLPYPVPQEFVLSQSILGSGDALRP